MKAILLSALVLMVTLGNSAAADIMLNGENTKIEFTGYKKNGKHTGGFKTVTGTASGTLADLKLELTIDVTSIYSDDEKLTGHLKSPDFFNIKEYPKAMFKLTASEKTSQGYRHTGELTMLGKTKPVSFTSATTMEDGMLKISSEFKINRTDWGMTYGKGNINDEVELKISVNAK